MSPSLQFINILTIRARRVKETRLKLNILEYRKRFKDCTLVLNDSVIQSKEIQRHVLFKFKTLFTKQKRIQIKKRKKINPS